MSSLISKIRKIGMPGGPTPLDMWNELPAHKAEAQLRSCCCSRTWAKAVVSLRPFATPDSLIAQAEIVWLALPEEDWLEAFDCHPRIGEKKAPTTKNLAFAESEQATAQQSLEIVAKALVDGNHLYEELFGFKYIVFASGRTASELLTILSERLHRTRDEELREASRQQLKITNLRLSRWLNPVRGAAKP